jgi:aspartyl-tRNA(Asn)/glutamyl-tRNA(Gln) amidotransferase subunit C
MLTREEVLHIAELARITLTDEETEKYQKDLSAILAYFEQLKEVDTDGVESIGHITGVVNVYREDKSVEFGDLGRETILENLPKRKGDYVQVKAVL